MFTSPGSSFSGSRRSWDPCGSPFPPRETTEPVFGPSAEAVLPQFIDMTSNTGYMSPFELPEHTEQKDAQETATTTNAMTATPHLEPTPFPTQGSTTPLNSPLANRHSTQTSPPPKPVEATDAKTMYRHSATVSERASFSAGLSLSKSASQSVEPCECATVTQKVAETKIEEGETHPQQKGNRLKAVAAQATTAANPSQNTPAEASHFSVVVEGHFNQKTTVYSKVPYEIGAYILFDGDRGTDMGCVSACQPTQPPPEDHQRRRRKESIRHAIAVASDEEYKRWSETQPNEAEETLLSCRALVEQKLSCQLTIVGAAYQFDKKKITFFYRSTEQRVDFRSLLMPLYTIFQCRIWMERLTDPLPSEAVDSN